MPPTRKAATGVIDLKRLPEERVQVTIRGITPVIPHRWSEKAKRMMPGHPEHEDEKRNKKGVRTPEAEADACVYYLPDGRPGIPASAFKAAMVSACRFFEKPTMTEAKLMFFVEGFGPDQLVPLVVSDESKTLREDTPRNANGGADLRYRYAFFPWAAEVTVAYVPSSISPSSIVHLLDAAGRVGVADWRPGSPKSSTGTFGQFRIVLESE